MSETKRYYFPEIYEMLPEAIYERAEQIRDELREDGIACLHEAELLTGNCKYCGLKVIE